jgi:hypothetical protein
MTEAGEGSGRWSTWRVLPWKLLADTIGWIIISYLFLIFVMTAVAQQEVVTRMAKEQLEVSWTRGLSLSDEAEKGRTELDRLKHDERRLAGELQLKQTQAKVGERQLEAAWQELLPAAERVAKTCELSLPADNPASRDALLRSLEECDSRRDALPPRVQGQLAVAIFQAKDVQRAQRDYASALNFYSTAKDFLEATREQIKSALELTDEQSKAERSFGDTSILKKPWMLIGRSLVQFPPPMLQILLTFVSGLFGALLITLVLIVYPKNVLDGAAVTQTWPRILLGGLIAMCVYVVILGGTAVLGSASELAGAGSNYMAMCGIGILAGMFSDRVAAWLSSRADAFFKHGTEQ